eukprot:c20750_g1_i6.p1 GENE.c20750_g1_i6~~c20750_g1_i6.p1  ORF type:complete len:126 (-),score=14.74 c20750_g1_i6:277-654(-)
MDSWTSAKSKKSGEGLTVLFFGPSTICSSNLVVEEMWGNAIRVKHANDVGLVGGEAEGAALLHGLAHDTAAASRSTQHRDLHSNWGCFVVCVWPCPSHDGESGRTNFSSTLTVLSVVAVSTQTTI